MSGRGRVPSEGLSVDLDFAVIGAQKAGSTFLHKALAAHADIEMPPGESRHFEDPWYMRGGPLHLEAMFTSRDQACLKRGIKRPDYLGRPGVERRLAAAAPNLKLLVVLRDPVARAISAYADYARMGFVPVADLDMAMRTVLSGDWSTRFPRSDDILEFGLYGKHLIRYRQYFPPDRIFVLMYDDLISDSVSAIEQALRFIGVRAGGARVPKPDNRGVYSERRLRLLRTRNRYMFRYSSDLSMREPREAGFGRRLWPALATGVDRLLLAPFDRAGAHDVTLETREKLTTYYQRDSALLSRVLGERPTWAVEPL